MTIYEGLIDCVLYNDCYPSDIFYLVLEGINSNRRYTLQDLAVEEDFAHIKKPSEPPFRDDRPSFFFGKFC